MTVEPVSQREVRGENAFALGLFAHNVGGGLTLTLAEERWEPTWRNMVAATRAAEEAGFEFVLPLAGWLDNNGEGENDGHFQEAFTWAAGLLEATERINVFATVHVPFVNPVFAAKQTVTCDHIGNGRFALNVVAGFHRAEFAMLGIEYLDHEARYAYLEEWLTIVKRLWSEDEPFDFRGEHFSLEGAWAKPSPVAPSRPFVVSAGSSPSGRSFALRQADALFMIINDLDALAEDVRPVRAAMAERPIDIFASGHVICRPTRKEAEEYLHYLIEEHGDLRAGETMRDGFIDVKSVPDFVRESPEFLSRMMSGHGTYRVIGSPDDVVETFQRINAAGVNGMAIALPNYLSDFPIIRDEVIPRMEAVGLRRPLSR